jgi:CHAD domain-containing protein
MERRLARGGAADLPRQLTALAAELKTSADGTRAGAVLGSRLRQRARVMIGAIDHVGVVYVPDALHAVRIAGKKLRYSLEIGHGAAGLAARVPLRELKGVQELLGGLHDRQMVQGWLQTVAAGAGATRTVVRTPAATRCSAC